MVPMAVRLSPWTAQSVPWNGCHKHLLNKSRFILNFSLKHAQHRSVLLQAQMGERFSCRSLYHSTDAIKLTAVTRTAHPPGLHDYGASQVSTHQADGVDLSLYPYHRYPFMAKHQRPPFRHFGYGHLQQHPRCLG